MLWRQSHMEKYIWRMKIWTSQAITPSIWFNLVIKWEPKSNYYKISNWQPKILAQAS